MSAFHRQHRPMHSTRLLHYFECNDHAGELAGATARVSLENPVCGDQLVLMAIIEGGSIRAIRYLARGCVAAIGTAAALCHCLEGGTLGQARQLTREHLLAEVGGLESASLHAAALALEARDRLLAEASVHL
jgi:nitrogen fixation NifU-like protein